MNVRRATRKQNEAVCIVCRLRSLSLRIVDCALAVDTAFTVILQAPEAFRQVFKSYSFHLQTRGESPSRGAFQLRSAYRESQYLRLSDHLSNNGVARAR